MGEVNVDARNGSSGRAFDEAVWDRVVDYTGPVSARCREAFGDDIDVYCGLGMDTNQVARVIRDRFQDHRARFEMLNDAFDSLVATVTALGRVAEGEVDRPRLVDQMLDTKLRLAKIYHDLARLAPLADVAGMPDPNETGAMIAESGEALEEWRAIHQTG